MGAILLASWSQADVLDHSGGDAENTSPEEGSNVEDPHHGRPKHEDHPHPSSAKESPLPMGHSDDQPDHSSAATKNEPAAPAGPVHIDSLNVLNEVALGNSVASDSTEDMDPHGSNEDDHTEADVTSMSMEEDGDPMPGHGAEDPKPDKDADDLMSSHEIDDPGSGDPMPGDGNEDPMPDLWNENLVPDSTEEDAVTGQENTIPLIDEEEDVATFEVDEEDLPTTSPAEGEDEEEPDEESEEEELPGFKGDGLDLDLEEELSRLDVRPEDLLASLDEEKVSRHRLTFGEESFFSGTYSY